MKNKQRVFITGANGTLAQELINQLNTATYEIFPYGSHELDVTDTKKVKNTVAKNKPNIIFHFAAKTDIDWCENNPNESYQINVKACQTIAHAAQNVGAILVFPSTYYVYSGLTKYPVDDRVDQPDESKIEGIYSLHKFLAEKIITETGYQKKFVVRLGSLFGGGAKDKKFVGKILRLIQTKKELELVTNRYVQPSFAKDTALNILELIKTKKYGTYNMVGHGIASFYEYAQAILEFSKRTDVKLIPITAYQFKEAAPRSARLEVINGKLQELEIDLMRPWKEALEEYITSDIMQKSYEPEKD